MIAMKQSQFKPAWWLPFSHLQTIWPALLRRRNRTIMSELQHERLELYDGDFLDLAWLGREETGPIVIVMHGFEGSIASHYALGMLASLKKHGLRSVFMHFRGCSGTPNRLLREYHSGETADLAYLVKVLQEREPHTPLAAVGNSLGGNVLLKWLGETGGNNPLIAAAAISVPFELTLAVNRVQRGFSRFYQWYLLNHACKRLQRKLRHHAGYQEHAKRLKSIKTIVELDELLTAPLHGFRNAMHYYKEASSRQFLRHIKVPTLIVHAKDDPFMTSDIIPDASELSSYVQLEVSDRGGHLGFVSGTYPWKPTYWLEERVPRFFLEHMTELEHITEEVS